MSKKNKKKSKEKRPLARLSKIKKVKNITEFVLSSNKLRILFVPRPNTGVVTTDIVYHVGSRDEARGETGIAHMLEHMLFKPTTHDIKRKTDAGAMHFEREVGVILNANTWKDRTSYFFSYPKEHFSRALRIEAERMQNVILTSKEFLPEQGNVLSEFDMYAGNEEYALSTEMHGTAFYSHPYGHETIGHREDIEAYTPEKLDKFYKKFYTPSNAVLIIAGDISELEMKKDIIKHFGNLRNSNEITKRTEFVEPKQRGKRTVTVKKPSTTQILGFGVKHSAFPTQEWFETLIIFNLLAGDSDSILYKALVDTEYAVRINTSIEPSREENLGELFITLTNKASHLEIEKMVQNIIQNISSKDITAFLKRTIAKNLLEESIQRESGLGYVSTLVEYVSADAWEKFFDSEKILKKITPSQIKKQIQKLFTEDQLTIGYFHGTK